MSTEFYNGHAYSVPDEDKQVAALRALGLSIFWYFPQERLVINSPETVEKYGGARIYPDMPYSVIDEFVCPEDHYRFCALYEDIHEGMTTAKAEFRSVDKKKKWKVALTVAEYDQNGQAKVVLGVIDDIFDPASKERSYEIEEKKNKYDAELIKNLLDTYVAVYSIDLKNDIYFTYTRTDDIQETYGYTNIYSLSIDHYIHEGIYYEDRDKMSKMLSVDYIRKRIQEDKRYTTCFRDVRSGEPRYMDMEVIAVDVVDDHVLLTFTDRDDEIRKTEKEKQIIMQQRFTKEIVQSGMWNADFDDDGNFIRIKWSDDFRHMLGYENEIDFPNEMQSWVNIIHPDDWQVIRSFIESDDFKSFKNVNTKMEYRLKTKDRGWRWYRVSAEIDRKPNGIPYRLYGIVFDVTERKEHELQDKKMQGKLKKIDESRIIMDDLYRAMNSGSWSIELNENCKIESFYISDALKKILGYDEEHYNLGILKQWRDLIHPADRETIVKEYLDAAFDTESSDEIDLVYRMITKDKGWRWFHSVGRVIRRADGRPLALTGLFKDIDAQKKEALELENVRKKQSEYFGMINGLSSDYRSVWFIDGSDNTIRMHRHNDKTTGADAFHFGIENKDYDEGAKLYIKSHVVKEDRERVWDAIRSDHLWQRVPKKGLFTVNFMRQTEGNVYKYYQMVFARAGETGEKPNLVLGFRDVDSIIRKDQEQQKLLEKALGEARRANQAKTVFLNNMSHDIRTPMNAIIGFTNLAQMHLEDKDLVESYLTKIMTSSNHLLSLINDVLDMSRIESGKLKIEEDKASLKAVLNDLYNIVQNEASNRKLDLSIGMVDLVNDNVLCDKLRLNQVLLNIIGNAIKFTKAGGSVKVTVTQKSTAVSGWATYEFRIKDTGIGMKKEFLKTIFEPFVRERTSTISKIQGTGLGMAITKSIVDMMKGTISVDSEQGLGTEFIVTFRFKVADDLIEEIEDDGVETIFLDKEELCHKKILLVEDNEMNQEIAESILTEAGFEVDTASDGTEAVEIMKKAAVGQYDLILMDVQMPLMNGYEATKKIRELEDKEIANIPVIAVTANAFEEDRRAALEAGMNDHISKPIDVYSLLQVMRKLL